jgi:predicted dehydrogenase
VRVAIVGGGLMGREIAAAIQRWPALVDHPVRPRLVAVADLNPDALEWFRQIDTVESLVTDYHDLLADPSIDVVYIAVRHDLHEQLYVDTIRAGKALLAEKPFGIDPAAAGRIIAEAEAHPESFVRVSSEMPFYPGAQWALRYLASGAVGRIVEARSAFLHSSDLDPSKPLNWKRQAKFCGEAGVMNDLGLHAWHLPVRLGWAPRELTAVLQNIVTERPGADGGLEPCDTWDNAVWHGLVDGEGGEFALAVETKRISPGDKNSWEFEVVGMSGGVRFSTSDPVGVWIFENTEVPGIGREQGWRRIEAGSQSVWPTVTGGIFEAGFSDAILQMWAAFLAERAGELGDRFGCATPAEALATHRMAAAAAASWSSGTRIRP